MSKFIILTKENLINKIKDLLKVKDLRHKLEAEINQKITELDTVMKDSFADTPKLGEIFGGLSSESKDKEFSLRSQTISKQSQVINHYIGALVSEHCLNELGWEFNLSSETFQTILDQDQEKTIQQHLAILYNYFSRFISKNGEIKPITKIKIEAFPLYVTPHIVANLTNLLYRLTNQDKYFVWTNYFDKFENDFFKVETEHRYVDDEDITYFIFTFTDDALTKLNEAYKTFTPPESDEDDDEYC